MGNTGCSGLVETTKSNSHLGCSSRIRHGQKKKRWERRTVLENLCSHITAGFTPSLCGIIVIDTHSRCKDFHIWKVYRKLRYLLKVNKTIFLFSIQLRFVMHIHKSGKCSATQPPVFVKKAGKTRERFSTICTLVYVFDWLANILTL